MQKIIDLAMQYLNLDKESGFKQRNDSKWQ